MLFSISLKNASKKKSFTRLKDGISDMSELNYIVTFWWWVYKMSDFFFFLFFFIFQIILIDGKFFFIKQSAQ